MDFILKLKEERKAMAADLDPKYILPSLNKFGAITPEEYESINLEPNKKKRFDKLFEILTNGSKNFNQFKLFVEALEEKDEEECLPYPWLAEKLKPALQLDVDVHKILVRGNVRLPDNHLLHREEKIQNIQKKLKESSHPGNPSKWVVLHGPIGSGKSSLAAEALRANNLIKDNFSGGVFWLDFSGNKKNAIDKLEIDKKIISILKLLNGNYKYNPDEDLTYLLKNEVLSKPKVLIILDEVCDKNIIKAFNVNCPILVTTTLKNILEDVSSHCAFIECPNDAEKEDIKLLLSKYANCKLEELPVVVDYIASKCGGSLLVASLIGASMNDVGNDEKTWRNWDKMLEEKGLTGVKKIEEEDVVNVIVNCIEHIKDWKEYFFDLVILKKGSSVSSEVLEILWSKDEENELTTFFIALQLYRRSFVVIKESETGSKFSLGNHDLYVDAVRKFLGEEKIKELHKKFIEKVFELGKTPDGSFDLAKLPNNYISTSLGYHLYQAGEFSVLEKLYLDLKFVEQHIHKISAENYCNSILNDYQSYESCFQNKKDAEDFKKFLERNECYIAREEKCDIIQLALFEPHDSIVYRKAKDYADKNKGLYYDWCNKMENTLNIRLHLNLKFGAINQDALLVACFNEVMYKESSWLSVWNISSEESVNFIEENFHGDINYCAFNSKGDFLATASDDKTVKIFKIRKSFPTKESDQDTKLCSFFLAFKKHEEAVVCCAFSPSDEYVISSDISGITRVWKFLPSDSRRQTSERWSFKHQIDLKKPFRFSSFSNKGDTIGTATHDTLKLWDFRAKKEKKEFCCKNRIIKKFIFTEDDSRILLILDNEILFWDVENDNEQIVYSDDSCLISSCCLSINGKYIACGMESGRIILIVVETGDRKVLLGHKDKIVNVMFCKNDTKLFSISPTCTIIRNVSGIENTPVINGSISVAIGTEPVIASSVSPYMLEIRKGQVVAKPNLDEKISTFALSNDGSEVVIGTENGTVKVFNVVEKCSIELLPKHSDEITYILHSKNNASFFTCSVDGTINIWYEKAHLKTLFVNTLPIIMCAEFKKCNKLLSCCTDGSLMVWNTDSGENIYSLEGHCKENITCCDISCDDTFLTAAFTNGSIMVWEAESGNLHKTFSVIDPSTFVTACQFSNETDLLIAGLSNGTIMCYHLWSHDSEPEVCESKHTSAVNSIKMISEDSPDGKSIFLSASKSIKLWDSDGYLQQTILLPYSSLADEYSKLYASKYFDTFVVALNSVLYILRRID